MFFLLGENRVDDAVRKALRQGTFEIYADLHQEQKNRSLTCDACGRCCHLASWGHQMWLTEPELMVLLDEHGLRRPLTKGVCPYLENEGCAARVGRPLGCRVFFCSIEQLEQEEMFETYFQKLVGLTRKHLLETHYFEMLTTLDELTKKVRDCTLLRPVARV